MSATWDALRVEYERDEIGVDTYRLLREIVVAVCRLYAPAVYAPTPSPTAGEYVWDDGSFDDVLHGFIADELLAPTRRQIDYLMQLGSVGDFRRVAIHLLRRYLARHRLRSPVDNLLQRARRLLETEAYAAIGSGARTQYQLRDTTVERRPPRPDELQRAIRAARRFPLQWGSPLDRAPRLLEDVVLGQLLKAVARALPTPFGAAELDEIFRALLTPGLVTVLVRSEGAGMEVAEQVPTALTPEEIQTAREASAMALADLGAELARFFALKFGSATVLSDAEVGRRLGVSRTTVDSWQRRTREVLAVRLDDLSEEAAEHALELLTESVQGHVEEDADAADAT
jgi:hypothetical protein